MKRMAKTYFRDFGYKMIRLKYFIIIVVALFLEIVTLTLYLLKMQNMLAFELFNLAILYGAISGIIVVLSIGILVLMKVDRKKDRQNITMLLSFQNKYRSLAHAYLNKIDYLLLRFDSERDNFDAKIEYAVLLEEKYDSYLKAFSKMDIPLFLKYTHSCELEHLVKEKEFYKGFSSLLEADTLKKLSKESEASHNNFLMELNSIEKSLKLII